MATRPSNNKTHLRQNFFKGQHIITTKVSGSIKDYTIVETKRRRNMAVEHDGSDNIQILFAINIFLSF